MKLLTLNVKDEKFISIAKKMSDNSNGEALFVDWEPLIKVKDTRDMANNIRVIENLPENVKLVVFDRYCALTPDEITYLTTKKNAILLEPRVIPRPQFGFIPYWIHKIDLPLSMWDNKREFHLGFKGDILTEWSESMLVKSIKHIPDINVGVSTSEKISKERFNIIKEIMSIGNFKWNRFKCCLVQPNSNDMLPDITNHLKYGVVPLVSDEYRWYYAIFNKFIIKDYNDIKWYIRMYDTCNYGYMEEIYSNIEKFMPEMIAENFVSTIISMVSK